MRFDESDQADGSSVEDRRGMGSSGMRLGFGAGGVSILGLLVYAAVQVLGGHSLLGGSSGGAPAPARQSSGGAPLTGSCAGVTSSSDPGKFIACVETNVQKFWTQKLDGTKTPYHGAKLVLFTNETNSGCGDASAETGPFYCPRDQKVYLDLSFFQELRNRFHAKGGDFAEAYVIAHEYGHHVQSLLGIDARMRKAQQARPGERNALSVRLELQADCFAGVWGHSAYEKGKVDKEEIAQALDAAAAIGDDRLQKQARGRVTPETFTHGSSADRQRWFNQGMTSGDPAACDTFAER